MDFLFEEGTGRYRIVCNVHFVGDDLIIALAGGEKHHIGAIAVGIPRASLSDKNKLSSDTSIITIPYHKDDLIARRWASYFSKCLGVVVTVTVGIHIDNATDKELKILVENVDSLFNNLKENISEYIID